ncbi:hypothetical protein BMETH_1360_0 [methanotrophic bacterial endosymbiont of Bathymodiolus sp.]|nr:hypothetical protein BMETH_1360_0 [methanotrophic bacterial endosymbiont of Bathymodiolus sp.]
MNEMNISNTTTGVASDNTSVIVDTTDIDKATAHICDVQDKPYQLSAPVSYMTDSSNKEKKQCQRDKTEILEKLHAKGRLVTLPLDAKVPCYPP